jgi:molybdopterin/thiamine biosynthesis adenylyltransferase
LQELALQINPRIEASAADRAEANVSLVVGQTPAGGDRPEIYVGSDGWILKVSSRAPVGVGPTRNPFGAAAAACFGAANVFRAVFGEQLPGGDLDGEIRMSVLDLQATNSLPANPPLSPTSLGETHLVGAGAIGNAAIWALARVPALTGALHVVDGEALELSNLQRYVLTGLADVTLPKVDLAAREGRNTGSGLIVVPHQARWGDYLRARRAPWRLQRVAVALDTAKDRIGVQAALPRWIANAWTQAGDLGLSRHPSFPDRACLACLYVPDGPTKNEDQLVAEAIGMTAQNERMEIRALLHSGAPVGGALIERIAAALRVPSDALIAYADKPLRTFYSEAVCGGVILRLLGSNGAPAQAVEVPLAFQSALAGVLLATALVADSAGLLVPAEAKAVINLLKPLGSELLVPIARHASGRCLCQDDDFLRAYRSQHESKAYDVADWGGGLESISESVTTASRS